MEPLNHDRSCSCNGQCVSVRCSVHGQDVEAGFSTSDGYALSMNKDDERLPLIVGQEEPHSTPHVGFRTDRRHGSITGSIVSVISQESVTAQHFNVNKSNGTVYTSSYLSSGQGANDLHCHRGKPARKHETRNAKRKLIAASVVVLLFLVGEFVGKYRVVEKRNTIIRSGLAILDVALSQIFAHITY